MEQKNNKRENVETLMKLGLYLISLWTLLFLLIVKTIDVNEFPQEFSLQAIGDLWNYNSVSIICIFLFLIGLIGFLSFRNMLDDVKNLPVKIQQCESVNYENLSFLATYIIPLVCFSLENERDIFILFAVIIIMGCIFVKTNLYYSNPTLLLVGFSVYKVKTNAHAGFKEGIIIVQGKIQEGDSVKYFKMSDNVYFGRKITNEKK